MARIAQWVKSLGRQSLERRFESQCQQDAFLVWAFSKPLTSKMLAWLQNTGGPNPSIIVVKVTPRLLKTQLSLLVKNG